MTRFRRKSAALNPVRIIPVRHAGRRVRQRSAALRARRRAPGCVSCRAGHLPEDARPCNGKDGGMPPRLFRRGRGGQFAFFGREFRSSRVHHEFPSLSLPRARGGRGVPSARRRRALHPLGRGRLGRRQAGRRSTNYTPRTRRKCCSEGRGSGSKSSVCSRRRRSLLRAGSERDFAFDGRKHKCGLCVRRAENECAGTFCGRKKA